MMHMNIIIIENSKEIIKKFKKFKKPVVFGTQYDLLSRLVFKKCLNTILCCGNIIGYVKYIKLVIKLFFKYKYLWKEFNNDDQVIFNQICSKEKLFKKIIGVDINKDIFFVASNKNRYMNIEYFLKGHIYNLKMNNGKLYNKFNKTISVLHLAGNINGNVYLEYLGYDTSNVELKIERYRLRQIYGFIKKINHSKGISSIILVILLVIILIFIKKYIKY